MKGLSAAWLGDSYQKSLTDSLEHIKTNGKVLVHQAFNAHLQASHRMQGVAEDVKEITVQSKYIRSDEAAKLKKVNNSRSLCKTLPNCLG